MNAPVTPRLAESLAVGRSSLAERLALVGTQMLKLAGEVSNRAPAGAGPESAGEVPAARALLGLFAAEVYRDRRRRARHLPSRLLGEPAWDILLDLYIADCRGHLISVSNACLAADAPASTALRWLQHLQADGLVERLADKTDARRHHVRLTEAGKARMSAYFAECREDLVGEFDLAGGESA